jgi:hypothetical protein
MSSESVTVRLAQRRDYPFGVEFGEGVPLLRADEPPPLGSGRARRRCNIACAVPVTVQVFDAHGSQLK